MRRNKSPEILPLRNDQCSHFDVHIFLSSLLQNWKYTEGTILYPALPHSFVMNIFPMLLVYLFIYWQCAILWGIISMCKPKDKILQEA